MKLIKFLFHLVVLAFAVLMLLVALSTLYSGDFDKMINEMPMPLLLLAAITVIYAFAFRGNWFIWTGGEGLASNIVISITLFFLAFDWWRIGETQGGPLGYVFYSVYILQYLLVPMSIVLTIQLFIKTYQEQTDKQVLPALILTIGKIGLMLLGLVVILMIFVGMASKKKQN